MSTNQYHDRIQRATKQLAQLQARELLATQRREAKTKEQAKREETRRRARVADLVFIAGAHALNDRELEALLTNYMKNRADSLHQPPFS